MIYRIENDVYYISLYIRESDIEENIYNLYIYISIKNYMIKMY